MPEIKAYKIDSNLSDSDMGFLAQEKEGTVSMPDGTMETVTITLWHWWVLRYMVTTAKYPYMRLIRFAVERQNDEGFEESLKLRIEHSYQCWQKYQTSKLYPISDTFH